MTNHSLIVHGRMVIVGPNVHPIHISASDKKIQHVKIRVPLTFFRYSIILFIFSESGNKRCLPGKLRKIVSLFDDVLESRNADGKEERGSRTILRIKFLPHLLG